MSVSASADGRLWRGLRPAALLAPVAVLYLVVYLGGLAMIATTSLGLSGGDADAHLSFAAYAQALAAPGIPAIVTRTILVGIATVAVCLILGFPVARYITSTEARWRGVVMVCVLSPLMVSAIGRIFGWIALFGPGSFVARVMVAFLGGKPTGLLYTETAMVIGLANLLLPFMVLSIAASRAHLDEDLLKASASLGATPLATFRQIELPLSLPGIVGGALIVFSLAASNFVTAALLGGSGRDVIAYHIYLDILVYFQERRGAALAVMLLIVEVVLLALAVAAGRSAADDDAKRTTP
jgi:putative spermidine/putrescine transport system permease protein